MASSAVSHALEDMLDLVDDEVGTRDTRDDEAVLFDNARAVLEDYKNAGAADAVRLADHVRVWLARVLQYVNQEMPELVGAMEMRNAQQVLSMPHLPASDAVQGGEPPLAPNEPGPVPDAPIGENYANAPARSSWEEQPDESSEEERERATREAQEGWDRAMRQARERGDLGPTAQQDAENDEEEVETESVKVKRGAKKGKK